jgi:Flp pilus assembly protein TadG
MTSAIHERRRARGNAMVEFVLVLPLLLVLLLGAIDWGFYFMVREVVINATREGARVGSVAANRAAASGEAAAAVHNYLLNALGATYADARAPDAWTEDVASYSAIRVRLQDFPVVPGRPASSISGFDQFTRVPTTITAEADMRLESP